MRVMLFNERSSNKKIHFFQRKSILPNNMSKKYSHLYVQDANQKEMVGFH